MPETYYDQKSLDEIRTLASQPEAPKSGHPKSRHHDKYRESGGPPDHDARGANRPKEEVGYITKDPYISEKVQIREGLETYKDRSSESEDDMDLHGPPVDTDDELREGGIRSLAKVPRGHYTTSPEPEPEPQGIVGADPEGKRLKREVLRGEQPENRPQYPPSKW